MPQKPSSSHPIPTLKTVALHAGVSVPTVSFVLNGKGGKLRIAEETRERVEKVAKELGYRANPFASSLRRNRSTSIGVIWPFSGPHQSGSLVRRFSSSAMKKGYATIVYDSMSDIKLIKAQLRELARWRSQGAVVGFQNRLDSMCDQELLDLLHAQPNVLVVANELTQLPFPQVIQAPHSALREAVFHLLGNGRRRIAFIGSGGSNSFKIAAIRTALQDWGAQEPLTLISHKDANSLERELMLPLIDQIIDARIDALITATDEMAALSIGMLRERGVDIPGDIAVVGFNNNPITTLFSPPIASIHRFDDEVATCAIEQVISMINAHEGERPLDKTFDMQFVWRGSAGGESASIALEKSLHTPPSVNPLVIGS